MRVGFVGNVPPPVGGAEVFLRQFLTRFTARGHHGTLARWRKQQFLFFPERVTRIYAPRGTVERRRRLSIHYLFEALTRKRYERRCVFEDRLVAHYTQQAMQAAQIFQRARVALIHSHMLFPNLLFASLAAKALSVPCVLTVHGMLEFRILDHVRKRYRRLAEMVEGSLADAAMVVGVSDEVANTCRQRGARIVRKMSCGIDTAFFTPLRNGRAQDGGVVFIGTVRKDKGAALLIQAFERLRGTVGGKLTFVGKRLLSGSIYERARRNRRIRFLGVQDATTVRRLLQHARLVVLPSESEGLPLSILEAMACERPVLVTKTGALTELIRHGHNGFLIQTRTARALAEQIRQVLSRTDLPAVCREARRTAAAFDTEQSIPHYEALYSSLCR